jgi:uncharacterized protein (DUF885 family)
VIVSFGYALDPIVFFGFAQDPIEFFGYAQNPIDRTFRCGIKIGIDLKRIKLLTHDKAISYHPGFQ